MKKLVIILAGEPESINSEIIVKAWKKSKKKNNYYWKLFTYKKAA